MCRKEPKASGVQLIMLFGTDEIFSKCVHYNFLKLHYVINEMTYVSPLYAGALTCNVNVNYTTQKYILRLR